MLSYFESAVTKTEDIESKTAAATVFKNLYSSHVGPWRDIYNSSISFCEIEGSVLDGIIV
jgi:hypothetical protein